MHFELKKKMLIDRSRSLLGDISTAAGDTLCLLDGWIGSYALLGLDRISLDRIEVKLGTPQGVKKEIQFNTLQYNYFRSYLCYINPYLQETRFLFNSIHIQKFFFTFSFISSSMSEAPTHFPGRWHDTGSFLYFPNFSRKQHARFSSIKYSMLGWFHNHHTCFWRRD